MFLNDKLFYQLSVLHRLFRKDAQEKLADESLDATLEMHGVLQVLSEHGPLPQQKIADLLFVEKSTMKRNIDKLYQRSYVTIDKSAPKSRIVTITATGEEVREKARSIMEHQEKKWLEPFSQDEQKQMLTNIQRMLNRYLSGSKP